MIAFYYAGIYPLGYLLCILICRGLGIRTNGVGLILGRVRGLVSMCLICIVTMI